MQKLKNGTIWIGKEKSNNSTRVSDDNSSDTRNDKLSSIAVEETLSIGKERLNQQEWNIMITKERTLTGITNQYFKREGKDEWMEA